MRAVVVAPYQTVIRRQAFPAFTGYEEVRLAVTQRGDSWIDSEAFFDDGESVWELIEECGLCGEKRCGSSNVEAEHRIVLGTDLGEDLGMLGEEMVGEDGTGRRSVVAGEDEKLDLSYCEIFEIGVDASS